LHIKHIPVHVTALPSKHCDTQSDIWWYVNWILPHPLAGGIVD